VDKLIDVLRELADGRRGPEVHELIDGLETGLPLFLANLNRPQAAESDTGASSAPEGAQQ
jgi:hypothetical protein